MLEIIWFILWTLLWAVYFVLDGFDLGIGSLMPFLAGNEEQKRLMYNAAGPFWDGNEVWLISAGGITFAAAWRKSWDCVHFIVNILACVVLGVFFANLFMGIPVDANGVYQGNLLKLFNIYGIAGGIFFTLIFMMHGAIWLTIKTRGPLQAKAFLAAGMLWVGVAAMLIIFLILTLFYTNIYSNYLRMPWLVALPLLAVFGLACIPRLLNENRPLMAWLSSALFIVCTTFFGVMGIYPNMIISSIDPKGTITAFNGCSTPMTLEIMLIVALVMVPIVLLYQFWMYRLFYKPVSVEDLNLDHAY